MHCTAAISTGIQPKLGVSLCSKVKDEKGGNTGQRAPLGIKGEDLLCTPRLLVAAKALMNQMGDIESQSTGLHNSITPIDEDRRAL